MSEIGKTNLNSNQDEAQEKLVIPRIEEELTIERQTRETGRVRISRHKDQETKTISEPEVSYNIDIKRVPKNEILTEPANTREEDGVTIIPVMEEVVVVTKQWVLREEIHLVPFTESREIIKEITLEKQRVDIVRLKPE